MTAASAALALLLAQRAFDVPPPRVSPGDDPAFAGSAAGQRQGATHLPGAPPQASQEPAGAGSTAATGGNPGEQLRQAQVEIQALRSQVSGVQRELADTQSRLAEETARAEGLERQLAELQSEQARQEAARRQQADEEARETRERANDTATATQGLAGAQQSLAAGDSSGVDAALAAELQRLEQARALAAKQGSDQEALRAGAAAQWIQAARDALARGDLFQAREALARAQAQAAGASALSGQAAGQPGTGSAAPPAGGGY